MVNSLEICEGIITRSRVKNGTKELSVLDFFIVCDRVLPFVQRMVIDEKKEFILTNYQNVRRGGHAVDSDHFTQILDLDLDFVSEKPKRVEVFNFKDKEAQSIFQKLTSETSEFSNCFSDKTPLLSQIEKWRRPLETFCKKSFKKIRIKKQNIKPIKQSIAILIDERNSLMKQIDEPGIKMKISEINEIIAEEEAKENRAKIINNFQSLSENPENINLQQMWKLCKRLWPKSATALPTAKRNCKGKIVSSPRDVRNVLSKEYKDRLRQTWK